MPIQTSTRAPESAEMSYPQIVVEALPDAAIVFDAVGLIQAFNAPAERLFGYGHDEVYGRHVRVLMPELGSLGDGDALRLLGTGYELTGARKDGRNFPVEISVGDTVVYGEKVFMAVLRDISQRRVYEQRKDRQIQQLASSNAELERFAHICSHDLKEPLRGMAFQAQFLLEDYGKDLPEEVYSRLSRIMHLGKRMQRQISDLLRFACLDTQDMSMDITNIAATAQDAIDELADVLKRKDAKVRIAGSLPQIICNRALVQSVFMNLICNGIKYNKREDKTVEISCLAWNMHAGHRYRNVFCVRDNGIGIEERHYKSIFDMFKRLNSDKAYGEGTGAGLAFVKKIVEKHGGTIWVESAPNAGTSFYFTLGGEKKS